jgi:hypothetical protein
MIKSWSGAMRALYRFIAILVAAVAPVSALLYAQPDSGEKQRLIVLSDIEADADDSESLVRLLLYSNQIEIEALIATTSTHMRTQIHPESMLRIIDAYDKVQPNLLLHDPRYPLATKLRAVVAEGQPAYGLDGIGQGKDSPGSERIVHALEQQDPRPLWISIWGGPNTLAQALLKIRNTRSREEAARLVGKLRVYAISDQDDSGAWIRKTFPDLFYIVSPGGYGRATWSAINKVVDGVDNTTISNSWIAANIQQGHGPLGAVYPDVAYGVEGDTPSFLALIPNGLNVSEHPDWGGWGGRYELYTPSPAEVDTVGFTGGVKVEPETRPIWTNAVDSFTPRATAAFGRASQPAKATFQDNYVTLWRWRDDFQNDFAARMSWTTSPFEKANHPPIPRLRHPDQITLHSGEVFTLDAWGTSDPDGDGLSYLWFQYVEAGSWKRAIPLNIAENMYRVGFTAPEVTRPETAHFILRVTDKGTPPLSRYKRVIVTILPRR